MREIKTRKWTTGGAVVMIDAHYLNMIHQSIRRNIERVIHRELNPLDIGALIENLLTSAGVAKGQKNTIQVNFIYDDDSAILENCIPSNLLNELNEQACLSVFGELCFNSYNGNDMANRDDLFLYALKLYADDINNPMRLLIVLSGEKYELDIEEKLNELYAMGQTKVIQLITDYPKDTANYLTESANMLIIKTLGITTQDMDDFVKNYKK